MVSLLQALRCVRKCFVYIGVQGRVWVSWTLSTTHTQWSDEYPCGQVGGHSPDSITRELWPRQTTLPGVWRAWESRATPPFDTHGNFESRAQSNSQPRVLVPSPVASPLDKFSLLLLWSFSKSCGDETLAIFFGSSLSGFKSYFRELSFLNTLSTLGEIWPLVLAPTSLSFLDFSNLPSRPLGTQDLPSVPGHSCPSTEQLLFLLGEIST